MRSGSVLLSIILMGCGSSQQPPRRFSSLQFAAKPFCEVMINPRPYVGRRILIKGIYVREPHQRILYDSACPQWEFRVSHSLKIDSNRAAERMVERAAKKDPTVSIPVVYYGTMTADLIISGCAKPSCYRYSLQDAQLLAASPR